MIHFFIQDKRIIEQEVLIVGVLSPSSNFFRFLKAVHFLFVLLRAVQFLNFFFQAFEPFGFSQLFLLQCAKSELLAFPVKLINDKRITNAHVTSGTTASLLLINVLMHNINQFLMKVLIVMSVLKQDAKKRTFRIEFVAEFVDQQF